jgi:hypothetical protein
VIEDKKILRKLAWEYFGIARNEKNAANLKLHKTVNDLKPIRPVVLIDELPWSEMNINDELTLRCGDPYLREIEEYMRRYIYREKYFPADMVVPDYIPVPKVVENSGIGITIEEQVLATDENNRIVSHRYEDKLKNEISTKIIEQTSQDEALNILRMRYVDGDITRKQYDQMKKDLGK